MTGDQDLLDKSEDISQLILRLGQSKWIPTGLLDSLGNVQVAVHQLVPYLTTFSLSLCAERDGMNQDLLDWYDNYFTIISRGNRTDLLSWSALYAPWYHFLMMTNFWVLNSRLPTPKVYNEQIRAEIRFQRNSFLEKWERHVDQLDSNVSKLQAHDMAFIDEANNAAIQVTKSAESNLTDEIAKRDSKVHHYFRSPSVSKEARELNILLGITQSLLVDLLELKKTMEYYRLYTRFLNKFVSELRSRLTVQAALEFSPSGYIVVPPFVDADLQLPSKSWLNRTTPFHDTDNQMVTEVTYYYHINPVSAEELVEMRSAFIKICEKRPSINITSGVLPMICTFWDAMRAISPNDNDLFNGRPTSWVQKRTARVMQRQQMGSRDENWVLRDASRLQLDFEESDMSAEEAIANYLRQKNVPPIAA
ncbi:MAG: hypothetical protein Q9224_005875 [Gallowayella concinna]